MSFEMPNIIPAIPEMFLLGMICTILVIDLFLSDRSRIITYLLAQLSLLGALFLTLSSMGTETVLTFSDTLYAIPCQIFLKLRFT